MRPQIDYIRNFEVDLTSPQYGSSVVQWERFAAYHSIQNVISIEFLGVFKVWRGTATRYKIHYTNNL